jgi:hypothetical protein
MSGDTLSSRNSSTRSTRSTWSSIRSSIWEPVGLRNSVSDLEDVSIDTRTPHFEGRLVEMCPVKNCESHRKGFTKAGDKNRHVLTHFKRALLCGFCETSTVAFTQSVDPATPFLAHLIKHHGVKEPDAAIGERCMAKSATNPVANCSVCLEPFTAQIMYEHLPGCILREVTQHAEAGAPRERGTINKIEIAGHPSDLVTGARSPVIHDVTHDTGGLVSSTEPECKDITELTASSRCLSLTSSKTNDSSEEETDWSEEVTSRESSPGLPQLSCRLTPTKRRIVETIMQEFHHLLNQSLRTHTAGGSSSSSTSGGAGGWSSNTSTYSSASFVSRKRSLSGGGSTPPNDDDDDSNKRRRPHTKAEGKQPLMEQRFACPYYKRNPGRHQTFTSCRDPGFTTVARLK